MAWEIASSHGLSRLVGETSPTCRLAGAVRELVEATETAIATGQVDFPRALLTRLRTQARKADMLKDIHPLGFGMGLPDRTCGDCAWSPGGRCLQTRRPGTPGRKVSAHWPSCVRWEPPVTDDSCGSCGACCRQGYSLAPVKRGEAMKKAHPEWVRESPLGSHLPRPDGLCVALEGNGNIEHPWRCKAYEARMRACSELAAGSWACLVARRRTGLSR